MDVGRRGLGRVSLAGAPTNSSSGLPRKPFREPGGVRSRIHAREKLLTAWRICLAGCFVLVILVALPALFRHRYHLYSTRVPEYILLHSHQITQSEEFQKQADLPVARPVALESITAGDKSTASVLQPHAALAHTGASLPPLKTAFESFHTLFKRIPV